jgi:hypothetical protein
MFYSIFTTRYSICIASGASPPLPRGSQRGSVPDFFFLEHVAKVGVFFGDGDKDLVLFLVRFIPWRHFDDSQISLSGNGFGSTRTC